jgi:hypothetical protein
VGALMPLASGERVTHADSAPDSRVHLAQEEPVVGSLSDDAVRSTEQVSNEGDFQV